MKESSLFSFDISMMVAILNLGSSLMDIYASFLYLEASLKYRSTS